MRRDKPDIGEVVYALVAVIRDIVFEIKELRKSHGDIDTKQVNLATSGVVICPQCGAPFEEASSKCQFCGYVSKERDQMLERLRAAKRGVEFEIREEQSQLAKTFKLMLFILAVPMTIAVVVLLFFWVMH